MVLSIVSRVISNMVVIVLSVVFCVVCSGVWLMFRCSVFIVVVW